MGSMSEITISVAFKCFADIIHVHIIVRKVNDVTVFLYLVVPVHARNGLYGIDIPDFFIKKQRGIVGSSNPVCNLSTTIIKPVFSNFKILDYSFLAPKFKVLEFGTILPIAVNNANRRIPIAIISSGCHFCFHYFRIALQYSIATGMDETASIACRFHEFYHKPNLTTCLPHLENVQFVLCFHKSTPCEYRISALRHHPIYKPAKG